MKARIFAVLAIAALFCCSCATEELPVAGGSIAAEIYFEVDTRTSVTDEGFFTWSAGDKVWIHTTGGGITGTLSSGAGTASANFSYGAYFGEMTGKAVYPYNSGHSISGDVLTVNLPATYELGSVRDNTNALMYGVSQSNSFKFNHMAGVMRFNLKNVPAGANQFKITLDKKINGEFAADLTESHPSVSTEETSNDSEKTITLNFDALTQTTDLRLCFPLPVGTYNTLALELNSATTTIWSYSNTVRNTVNRKGLVLMPTVNMGGSVSGDIENDGGNDSDENETDLDSNNLSANGKANSYIVSEAGEYHFTPTKGNSSEVVGEIASVEVLWESFGTNTLPSVGSLIQNVRYENGLICFETPETYSEGNALIAVKDANNVILWSWHIWLTDQPEEHVYANNAGTMMDRNLGATSATPGDVRALGLHYQWGRKDPFIGASSISGSSAAICVSAYGYQWNEYNVYNGTTLEYAIANPMTFIVNQYGSPNRNWLYSSDGSLDNTLWQSTKTIYDPCPPGWRVPDGYGTGVWANAGFEDFVGEVSDGGVLFPASLCGAEAWYPVAGYLNRSGGYPYNNGFYGYYWSTSTREGSYYNYYLSISEDGETDPSSISTSQYYGFSVRCQKENTGGGITVPDSEEPVIDLSINGTANCYVISEPGTYEFPTVKSNSSTSVGTPFKAKVLWESFGTDQTPNVGDIIAEAYYSDGKVVFSTPEVLRNGNALIAVLDASNIILWSWHIWCSSEGFNEQTYANGAGIMMDRNLGATSATPGDVGALGLAYQWGRKDPFLTSSSITAIIQPASTITWPESVESTSTTGTPSYAHQHPTTFIDGSQVYKQQGGNTNTYYGTQDWYYNSPSNYLWTSQKTLNDPCPSGWKVCDGGDAGIWTTAGIPLYVLQSAASEMYDPDNCGYLFPSSICGSDSWYPYMFSYFSNTPHGDTTGLYHYYTLGLVLRSGGRYIDPSDIIDRNSLSFVRCQKIQ